MNSTQKDRRIWLISDTHFKDASIIPFTKFEDMPWSAIKLAFDRNQQAHSVIRNMLDEYIVDAWNKIVSKDDIVYHLGDVGRFSGVKEAASMIDSLNGTKYLVMGNHDYEYVEMLESVKDPVHFWNDAGFERVIPDIHRVSEYIMLTHKPPEFPNLPYIWIHGHVHGCNLYRTFTESSYCVCVDRTEFKPILFDSVVNTVTMYRRAKIGGG